MNIIQALKSGRRFRRPGHPWKTYFPKLQISQKQGDGHLLKGFTIESILADDWEVEEKIYNLSETQLREVVDKWCTVSCPANTTFDEHMLHLIDEVCNEK